jgi:hypothetical protein
MKICDVSDLYSETARFYDRLRSQLTGHNNDFGYRLIYGPAFARPRILWLAFQPGGSTANPAHSAIELSGLCAYSYQNWTLARRMRAIFPIEVLRESVAVNAIFIRSPRIQTYKRLSVTIRRDIFAFCKPRIERLIWRLDPTLVVVIGLATLRLFDRSPVMVRLGHNGKALVRRGKIGGRRVIAVPHLSGSRIGKADLNKIAAYTLSLI